ncbi:MAG: NAD(P)H-binding protein [Myxococcaceae bacterium]|nr:NAD(P)H-binding protein [Myxococcaceae bacterium]
MNGRVWLVIGSTGRVGREVVRELSRRGEKVRVLVRSPERAAAFPPEVERVRGDLADVSTIV